MSAEERVYQTARRLGVSSKMLLSHLARHGHYFAGAGSLMSEEAVRLAEASGRDIDLSPGGPFYRRPNYWRWEDDADGFRTSRSFDNWVGPEEITTSEAAAAYQVAPATIRHWVKRGHLTPSGRWGRTHLFSAAEVNRAAMETSRRNRQPASYLARGEQRSWWDLPAAAHVTRQDLEAILGTETISNLTGIPAATIRSWRHRRLLQPVRYAGRTPLYRVADVVKVARRAPYRPPAKRR